MRERIVRLCLLPIKHQTIQNCKSKITQFIWNGKKTQDKLFYINKVKERWWPIISSC